MEEIGLEISEFIAPTKADGRTSCPTSIWRIVERFQDYSWIQDFEADFP